MCLYPPSKVVTIRVEGMMKKVKTLFGMRLKELRKNSGFSQEELAEKVEISSKYLSRIEMGQHFPSIDTLVKFADVLNVELKDLFEFTHETPSIRELKAILNSLLNEADKDKLRLLVKVVKAVVK
jgi:transcriptional regulator with XRE-family HTH domain